MHCYLFSPESERRASELEFVEDIGPARAFLSGSCGDGRGRGNGRGDRITQTAPSRANNATPTTIGAVAGVAGMVIVMTSIIRRRRSEYSTIPA